MEHADQLVTLAETDDTQSAFPNLSNGIDIDAFHRAKLCDKKEIMSALRQIFLHIRQIFIFRFGGVHFNWQNCRHFLLRFQLQKINPYSYPLHSAKPAGSDSLSDGKRDPYW